MTTTKTKPAPPAGAVAKDAHWAQTMARLDGLKPAQATLKICPDPEVRDRLTRARYELEKAKATLEAARGQEEADADAVAVVEQRRDRAQAEHDEAQAAFDEQAIVLRFQALPRTRLQQLAKEHPPTEQDEEAGEDFAMDTFAPALIAAASLDGMPVDYARHCMDTWSAGEATALWQAAWGVQHQQRTDLGKG